MHSSIFWLGVWISHFVLCTYDDHIVGHTHALSRATDQISLGLFSLEIVWAFLAPSFCILLKHNLGFSMFLISIYFKYLTYDVSVVFCFLTLALSSWFFSSPNLHSQLFFLLPWWPVIYSLLPTFYLSLFNLCIPYALAVGNVFILIPACLSIFQISLSETLIIVLFLALLKLVCLSSFLAKVFQCSMISTEINLQQTDKKDKKESELLLVKEKRMVDKYLIKSGMLRFSFLLECCHPGSIPDPQLVAAMLVLVSIWYSVMPWKVQINYPISLCIVPAMLVLMTA